MPAIFHHSSVSPRKNQPTSPAATTAETHASAKERSSERASLGHWRTSVENRSKGMASGTATSLTCSEVSEDSRSPGRFATRTPAT